MARPIQNLWPETRAVAATVAVYAIEDGGTFLELIDGGTAVATLVSPNGYVSIDPTLPAAEFRFLSVGTSPIGIAPV
jgi:hypothetical protein